jgi:uncharacterized protein (TIGR00266 family)
MKYKITGEDMQVLEIELEAGQTVYSESGGMAWMSGNMKMETQSKGLAKVLSRVLVGESLFINKFTPTEGTGMITFSACSPGKILPIQLAEGQSIICQKQAFLCGEESVDMAIHFSTKLGRGLFGGEGFIMQKLTGPGLVFLEIDGEVMEYNLAENQELKVDNGYIAYFEPTMTYDVKMVSGVKNIVFGGEGLFMATIKGPGKVVLQSMPTVKLAQRISSYLPPRG